MLEPDSSSPNKRGSLYNKRPVWDAGGLQKIRIGGLWDPIAPAKINKKRGDPSAFIEFIKTSSVEHSREYEG